MAKSQRKRRRRSRALDVGQVLEIGPGDDLCCPSCGRVDGLAPLDREQYREHAAAAGQDVAWWLFDQVRADEVVTLLWCHCCGWGGMLGVSPPTRAVQP